MRRTKFIFLLLLFPFFAKAYNYNKSQLETKKQAVFINSIIEQISGFNNSTKDIKIAIIDNVELYESLKDFTKTKQFSLKKNIPLNYSNLALVKNVDVLYVNFSSGYKIEQLLDFIHNTRILLITEGYEYQASVINILSAQGCYYVDLQEKRLNNSGFIASENLKNSIISSEENWNALSVKRIQDFQKKLSMLEEEQKELTREKNNLQEEKQGILSREGQILNRLSEKDNEIEKVQALTLKLKSKTSRQQEEYLIKLEELRDLENQFQDQEQLVLNKEKELENQSLLITEQNSFFIEQKEKINHQASILGKQTKEIEEQRQFSFLLMGVVVLISIFVIFIFITRAKEKRFIVELEQKNKEIEKTSKKLKRQNKELEQFAYIASHDLQEPLHTVTSFADFMLEDYNDKLDESGQQYLNFMKQGCKRMSNLITALLDYSKIGTNKDMVTINSSELINTITEDFNSLVLKTNSLISYGEMPIIEGYEVELRLLFQNLISNAIKFRKPNTQPKVFIEGRKINSINGYLDCWHFSVKDNGIGIAKEHHHKIFSIFKRLHNLEEYQGTGIGLAHCEKIVALHNGSIWLESNLNEGATFHFTIQLNKKKAIAA